MRELASEVGKKIESWRRRKYWILPHALEFILKISL
jgi:hypothetical protein